MLSYYVIYCEKFRKILQRTEKVALIKQHQTWWIWRWNFETWYLTQLDGSMLDWHWAWYYLSVVSDHWEAELDINKCLSRLVDSCLVLVIEGWKSLDPYMLDWLVRLYNIKDRIIGKIWKGPYSQPNLTKVKIAMSVD